MPQISFSDLGTTASEQCKESLLTRGTLTNLPKAAPVLRGSLEAALLVRRNRFDSRSAPRHDPSELYLAESVAILPDTTSWRTGLVTRGCPTFLALVPLLLGN